MVRQKVGSGVGVWRSLHVGDPRFPRPLGYDGVVNAWKYYFPDAVWQKPNSGEHVRDENSKEKLQLAKA